MGALKDVYEVVFDLAIKANLPTEVARLRGKLEQLEQEHAREVQRLKNGSRALRSSLKLSPPISSEKAPPVAPGERIDKDDLRFNSKVLS